MTLFVTTFQIINLNIFVLVLQCLLPKNVKPKRQNPRLEKGNAILLLLQLLLLCMSLSDYTPCILKQGGLESSGLILRRYIWEQT